MKPRKSMLIASLAIVGSAWLMSSCGSKQKAVASGVHVKGEVEVVVPCSGPEFQSDQYAIRYSSVGESMNQSMAKNKAYTEARAGLASSIETTLKKVVDSYAKSTEHNNIEDLQGRYEGFVREVVNQTLNGTKTICEKVTRTKTGNYKTYLCLELGGEQIMESANERLSNDEKLRINYDYEKFKETFEKEMKNSAK